MTAIDLSQLSDDALMELRFCDLPIAIAGSWVEPNLAIFFKELEEKKISFRPAIYLADEWLCPEGIPAIGIPFYLAHPRLWELERKMMLEVEGGSAEQFLKLLRHEMGHAISYAFHFQKRAKWRKIFGPPSREFSDYYRYRKYSRWYVHHLENFYAQSHPDEDFAETFAVWLDPASDWKNRYQKWKAMEKLEYVDHLMQEVSAIISTEKIITRHFNIQYLKSRLKTFYQKKQRLYAHESPDYFDAELHRIFLETPTGEKPVKASVFLRQNRKFIVKTVAAWTGERRYIADQVLSRLSERSREKNLFCATDTSASLAAVVACLTTMMKHYQLTGLFKEER